MGCSQSSSAGGGLEMEYAAAAPAPAPAPAPASSAAAPAATAAAAASSGAGMGAGADSAEVTLAVTTPQLEEGDDESGSEADEEEVALSDDEFAEAEADEQQAGAGAGAGEATVDEDGNFIVGTTDVAETEFMAVKPWIGAMREPESWAPPAGLDQAPDASLDLAFVHGYRCRSVYNNVFHSASGELVYPAAAVGIMQAAGSRTQTYFRKHHDDIISLAMDRNRRTVATGGKTSINGKGRSEDPCIYIWDSKTQEVIAKAQGTLKRAVVTMAFSPDGRYVAAVDASNDHQLLILDARTGATKALAKTGTDKVMNIGWSQYTGLLVTVGVKHCTFWTFNSRGLSRPHKGLVGRKGKRCTNISVGFTPTHTWTGTAHGDIYVWDNNRLSTVLKAPHGACKVNAIAVGKDMVASGGSDGSIIFHSFKGAKIGSFTVGSAVRALSFGLDGRLAVGTAKGSVLDVQVSNPAAGNSGVAVTSLQSGHFDGETWALALAPFDEAAVTAGDDNRICKWDLNTNAMIATRQISAKRKGKPTRIRYRGGASTMSSYAPNQCCRALDWGASDLIAAGCNNGEVLVMRASDMEILARVHDTKQWIQAVRFDPSGERLAVGSHDNKIYIYDCTSVTTTGNLDLVATCKGHNSFITSLDWNEAGIALHSTCGAYELLYWDADNGNMQPHGATMHRNEQWASWTAPLGWPVQGIWPKRSKGSDINTLDRSPNRQLLAVGDDWSRIRLFRYPCVNTTAKAKTFRGHSSHITCVRFNSTGNRMVSLGGNDNAVFVWNVQAE